MGHLKRIHLTTTDCQRSLMTEEITVQRYKNFEQYRTTKPPFNKGLSRGRRATTEEDGGGGGAERRERLERGVGSDRLGVRRMGNIIANKKRVDEYVIWEIPHLPSQCRLLSRSHSSPTSTPAWLSQHLSPPNNFHLFNSSSFYSTLSLSLNFLPLLISLLL